MTLAKSSQYIGAKSAAWWQRDLREYCDVGRGETSAELEGRARTGTCVARTVSRASKENRKCRNISDHAFSFFPYQSRYIWSRLLTPDVVGFIIDIHLWVNLHTKCPLATITQHSWDTGTCPDQAQTSVQEICSHLDKHSGPGWRGEERRGHWIWIQIC